MGLTIHIAIALLGLSAVIANSVLLFNIIKYAGAAFLIFMGISALFSKRFDLTPDSTASNKKKKGSYFLHGLLSNVLNPKAIIFFMAFLPQFMIPGQYNLLHLVMIGITPVLLTILWLFIYVNLINSIRSWFQKPLFISAFQRLSGIMLMSLGMKLAFDKE